MRDPHAQREDDRAREDDEYTRQLEQERVDRAREKASLPPRRRDGDYVTSTVEGAAAYERLHGRA